MCIKVKGQYRHYNPNLKPTKFKPGYPNHTGFYYYGFPPDLGTTYSAYECDGCTETSIMGEHHNFCPRCGGKTMAEVEMESNQEEILQSIQSGYVSAACPCSKCGSNFVTSLDNLDNVDKLHCPKCGDNGIYSNLKNLIVEENTMKAGLLKVISELKERGELTLANELEEQLNKDADVGLDVEELESDLSSGVEMDLESGDREHDRADMEEEEQDFEETKLESSLSKAVAGAQVLINHGIATTIIKANDSYKAVATEDLEEGLIEEDGMEEDEPEIVEQAVAEMIIRANERKGIRTRVTRVESGFVVQAMDGDEAEDMMEEGEEEEIESEAKEATDYGSHNAEDDLGHETDLPEENAEAVMYEEEITESDMDEEDEEPEIMDEDEAEAAILAFHKQGKDARVVKVESGFIVTAMEGDDIGESASEDDSDGSEAGDHKDGLETVLPEEKAEAKIKEITASGKNAQVTRVIGGYVVTAMDMGEEEELGMDDADMDEEQSMDEPVGDEVEEEMEEIKEEAEDEAEDVEDVLSNDSEEDDMLGDSEAKAGDHGADDMEEEMSMDDEDEDEEMEAKIYNENEAEAFLKTLEEKNVTATVTKVGENKFVIKAMDEEEMEEEDGMGDIQPDPENPELETTEEMQSDFTSLANEETFADVTEDDIIMLLQAEVEEDPFYNIIVKGMPVAKIMLSAQQKPEEIKEYFPTEQYAMDIVDAMFKVGVKKTLKNVNAKFYANEVVNANLKDSLTATIKDASDKKYAEAVASIRDDIADRLSMVIAGCNKGFWKNDTNHLKVALFDQLEGKISDEEIVAALEDAFEEGVAPQFGLMLDKAIAYLDTAPEALTDIKKAIGEADIQSLEYVGAEDEEEMEDDEEEEAMSYAGLLSSKKNVPVK